MSDAPKFSGGSRIANLLRKALELYQRQGWPAVCARGIRYLLRPITWLALRPQVATALRRLPGSSEVIGPPRRLIQSLRQEIAEVSNPRDLLESNEDLCLKLADAVFMQFREPKTLPGRPALLADVRRSCLQPESVLFSLNWARVVGEDGTIVTRRDELFGEGSPWGLEELRQRLINVAIIPGRKVALRGTYLHVTGRWHTGYFHWMFDIVSRLVPLLDFPELRTMPMIVPSDILPIQLEVLEMLGFTGSVVRQPSKNVMVEKLLYPSPVRQGYCPPMWVLEAMRSAFGVRTDLRPAKRIYITRDDAINGRRVVNEEEIFRQLEKLGFEKVRLAGKAFKEQIRIFSHAEYVVGPHGSGFCNLLFSPGGTRVLELFSPQYVHGAYYSLADTLGLDYQYLVGRPAYSTDMVIPVEDVLSILCSWGMVD